MTGPRAEQINWGSGSAVDTVAASQRLFDISLDGRYSLQLAEAGIVFTVDRLRRRFGELVGELTVTCDLPGARVVDANNTISVADFNLSSQRARTERAALLAKRSEAGEVDWYGLVEDLCARVLAAERAGQPAVHLRDVARPRPDEELDLDGWRLLRSHPVIAFGDGGSLKSILALYAAGVLTQRGLRVLYCDWEFTGGDHRVRLERLFPDAVPDVLYARCDRPLVDEIDRLRRIVTAEGIDYACVDSIAFACDGPPEAAETAAHYFRATRALGVGSLHVAHTTKAENGDQKPFGSAFFHNGARATWYVQRTTESAAGAEVTIGLFNRKANTGPLRPAVGFTFRFDEDAIDVRRADVARVPELAEKLPLWQRLRPLVAHGPKTIKELAEDLGAEPDSVKRAVARASWLYTKVPSVDGPPRIALVERRAG